MLLLCAGGLLFQPRRSETPLKLPLHILQRKSAKLETDPSLSYCLVREAFSFSPDVPKRR